MNKKELVRRAAEETGYTQKECALLLDTFLSITMQELAEGGDLLLTGFGSLSTRRRAPRTGVSPRTGEKIEISGGNTVAFKAGTSLRAALDAAAASSPDDN